MKRKPPTLYARVTSLEHRMGEVERKQDEQTVKLDALGDKLDLVIEFETRRMDRRNKVICTLIGAISATIGAIFGVACV